MTSDDAILRMPIERVSGVVPGPDVPIVASCDARWVRDAKHRSWVMKPDLTADQILAEAASFLLGQRLGVRQPAGAFLKEDDRLNWLSERIRGASEHWQLEHRDGIANPDEVGSMLALDALVLNEDRHERNIMVVRLDEARYEIWAIDNAAARVGVPRLYCAAELAAPNPSLHARGLPVELLHGYALKAADRAQSLPWDEVRAIVVEACSLVGESKSDDLTDAVFMRCQHAGRIVGEYVELLGALP